MVMTETNKALDMLWPFIGIQLSTAPVGPMGCLIIERAKGYPLIVGSKRPSLPMAAATTMSLQTIIFNEPSPSSGFLLVTQILRIYGLMPPEPDGQWRWGMSGSISMVPLQTNSYDSGMFVVTNALSLSLGLDPSDYTELEMSHQRSTFAIRSELAYGGGEVVRSIPRWVGCFTRSLLDILGRQEVIRHGISVPDLHRELIQKLPMSFRTSSNRKPGRNLNSPHSQNITTRCELKEIGGLEHLRNIHTRYFTAETLQPGDHLGLEPGDDKFQLATVVVRRRDGVFIHPYHVQWMIEFLDKINQFTDGKWYTVEWLSSMTQLEGLFKFICSHSSFIDVDHL
ncbi:hypothetical protein PFICI_06633 [Pestalotiopsis fici W106-1]|uniref:Uncharacterized protein n=1 Tax=Pestalotiopsis fici (strain W106-1 / CGMCC3.15140) TaxID=1229662 RepID=W3X8Y0_PESFW|nr:uncharacterized protein PFICI_06633 [Pestalotiopsis fici W106-1]ETS81631.1 hypothetical protein PFICI_06633 [Pestalotiopsis fici W106-1]